MKDLLRRYLISGIRILQWIVAISILALAAIFAVVVSDFNNKGVNTSAPLLAASATAILAVCLSPPVLFRLPGKMRVLIYVLIVPALLANIWAFGDVSESYELTPKGKQEAKQHAAAEAARLENESREAESRSALERAETDRANLDASNDKVAACINWRGQVPALTEYIKTRLHNPRSFEHVQTRAIDLGGKVKIVMEYRGENGFGATRAESVLATISPEDCSVAEVLPF